MWMAESLVGSRFYNRIKLSTSDGDAKDLEY